MKTLLNASKIFICVFGISTLAACSAKKPAAGSHMVARMEVKEPIPGVCDNDNVLALSIMSLMNPEIATDAKCALSEAEMAKKLNAEVAFLKQNPDFNGKGMISMIISCTGEAVQISVSNKSGSPELDAQILAVFNTFTSWQAGKYQGKPVDSSQLFSYTIKDGVLSM